MLRMSNHSQLRDLMSDDIHFKNKYKFMILKITLMRQIKEAFVGSIVNENLHYNIHYSLIWGLIYSENIFKNLASFICAYMFNIRFNDCDLADLILYLFISKIFFRILSENNCSHKDALLIIKHIWRTNWITSGHETTAC